MRKKNEFDTKELARRTASTVLIATIGLGAVLMVAIGLGLAGYGKQAKQMARIEKDQLVLQRMVQASAQQMADDVARIQENQSKLSAVVADVQTCTGQNYTNITALKQEQIKLQQTVQENTQKLAGNIATLEQEQMKLREIVQQNGNQLVSNIAIVDRNQRRFQSEIERLRGDIRTLATADALEDSLLTLQETVLKSARDLTSIIELTGQKQLKFEERIQNNVQTMANSIGAVERSQTELQDQIADVQASTVENFSNIIALKQEQTRLQQTAQENSQQLAGHIAALEQNQVSLQETVQSNGSQLVTDIATVDQNQRRFQSEIERLQGNIRALATADAFEQSLLILQETVLDSTRDLASIIGLMGRKQIKFEEGIQGNIKTMVNSIAAIERNQAKLQEHIADVQASIVTIPAEVDAIEQRQTTRREQAGDVQNEIQVVHKTMTAVLEQLRGQLSQISSQISSVIAKRAEPSVVEGEE